MGIHVTGNNCELDSDSNIKKIDEKGEKDIAIGLIKSQSCNLHRSSDILQTINKKMLTSCWICEGWQSVEIKLEGSVKGKKLKSNITADDFVKGKQLTLSFVQKKITNPVFVHFEFDN